MITNDLSAPRKCDFDLDQMAKFHEILQDLKIDYHINMQLHLNADMELESLDMNIDFYHNNYEYHAFI